MEQSSVPLSKLLQNVKSLTGFLAEPVSKVHFVGKVFWYYSRNLFHITG